MQPVGNLQSPRLDGQKPEEEDLVDLGLKVAGGVGLAAAAVALGPFTLLAGAASAAGLFGTAATATAVAHPVIAAGVAAGGGIAAKNHIDEEEEKAKEQKKIEEEEIRREYQRQTENRIGELKADIAIAKTTQIDLTKVKTTQQRILALCAVIAIVSVITAVVIIASHVTPLFLIIPVLLVLASGLGIWHYKPKYEEAKRNSDKKEEVIKALLDEQNSLEASIMTPLDSLKDLVGVLKVALARNAPQELKKLETPHRPIQGRVLVEQEDENFRISFPKQRRPSGELISPKIDFIKKSEESFDITWTDQEKSPISLRLTLEKVSGLAGVFAIKFQLEEGLLSISDEVRLKAFQKFSEKDIWQIRLEKTPNLTKIVGIISRIVHVSKPAKEFIDSIPSWEGKEIVDIQKS